MTIYVEQYFFDTGKGYAKTQCQWPFATERGILNTMLHQVPIISTAFHSPIMSTKISKMFESVTGTFLLHDVLCITTTSGSIDVTIIPQPAPASSSSSGHRPAELHLETQSGSIRVTMAPFLHDPAGVTPERIFYSSIESMSGSITATLIHNYKTTLSTMSGRIDASIYPCQPNARSLVGLDCKSGSASLAIHPYVDSPQISLGLLSANCSSRSGRLKIRFPSTWEGTVSSNVKKDRIRHRWEGLRVLENGPNFTAIKGNGMGRLSIAGPTGGIELVGERVPGCKPNFRPLPLSLP